jgi:hypothetical protein
LRERDNKMAYTKKTKTANTATAVSEEVSEEIKETTSTETVKEVKETVKKERTFAQTDPILCRSVTPGWLGVSGKSGMYYVFSNYGDETEIEYGDLFALKNKHSRYLYDPLFVIEDDELLENARWKDIAEFYSDKVYGMDDINDVLNKPNTTFKSTLKSLPKGLLKAVTVEVAKRIEDGSFDSLKKIQILDEVCGTDFGKMIGFGE